jgi:hypothetical protein
VGLVEDRCCRLLMVLVGNLLLYEYLVRCCYIIPDPHGRKCVVFVSKRGLGIDRETRELPPQSQEPEERMNAQSSGNTETDVIDLFERLEVVERLRNVERLSLAAACIDEYILDESLVVANALEKHLRRMVDLPKRPPPTLQDEDIAASMVRLLVSRQYLRIGPRHVELEAMAERARDLLRVQQVLKQELGLLGIEVDKVEYSPVARH